ncbi:hypothetical protein LY76DRAFT_586653 [Colletotrichum caudatum]|nr:hypothetical protein LY76DRAFT_586653 [Colletotrichum caudatum]
MSSPPTPVMFPWFLPSVGGTIEGPGGQPPLPAHHIRNSSDSPQQPADLALFQLR